MRNNNNFTEGNYVSVCEVPPAPQLNSITNPIDISGQFFPSDSIEYSCRGDLVPNSQITITCTDQGANLAVWLPALPLPNCSK